MEEPIAIESGREDSAFNRLDSVLPAAVRPVRTGTPIYEELLDRDLRWALSEGSQHFEENSAVFKALHKIASRLKALGIPYAVIGGMALFRHGFRRFTEDVDILVTKQNLKRIHENLVGRGYLPPFAKSKHLRDTEFGVRIEFLTTGDYPGDGMKKPIAFPDPDTVCFEADGINFISLPKLVELKLASGMTNSGRLKDLSDVLELIKVLEIPADFADQLDPYVRDKFHELWKEGRKRFYKIWRNKWKRATATSIDEMSSNLRSAADELEQMRKDGILVQDHGGADDDLFLLVTYDPNVAQKYGLVDASEFWDDEGDDDISEGASNDLS
jgi:hypothetical protein